MSIKLIGMTPLIMFIMYSSAYSATWKKLSSGTAAAITPAVTTCPTGYIGVPADNINTFRYFCVAKYEMKDDGYGSAASIITGTPWVGLNRADARAQCEALGSDYDLISNGEWQTIAQNIAGVAANWSGQAIYSGQLAYGHADNSPASLLAAAVDSTPCSGVTTAGVTTSTCSQTVWHNQRRTNTLSNGNIIWDFAGNADEWVTNNATTPALASAFLSNVPAGDLRMSRYGIATLCAAPTASPYCGYGYGTFAGVLNSVVRGGNFASTTNSGVFALTMAVDSTLASANAAFSKIGFRCVYYP